MTWQWGATRLQKNSWKSIDTQVLYRLRRGDSYSSHPKSIPSPLVTAQFWTSLVEGDVLHPFMKRQLDVLAGVEVSPSTSDGWWCVSLTWRWNETNGSCHGSWVGELECRRTNGSVTEACRVQEMSKNLTLNIELQKHDKTRGNKGLTKQTQEKKSMGFMK